MKKYRVSFYDTSDQKLVSVILEFKYNEVLIDMEKFGLYSKAGEVRDSYIRKKAKTVGVCSCDGLQIWTKAHNMPWVRMDKPASLNTDEGFKKEFRDLFRV